MEIVAPAEWSANDTKVLQVLANVLASQNREAKAADLLEFALNREPKNPEVLKALCGVYMMLERYSDTLEMIDRYVATGDTSAGYASLLLIKGQALWGLGREAEAVGTIKEYLSLRNRP
jgi:tetratricopeptide (TPR) repeat protein